MLLNGRKMLITIIFCESTRCYLYRAIRLASRQFKSADLRSKVTPHDSMHKSVKNSRGSKLGAELVKLSGFDTR